MAPGGFGVEGFGVGRRAAVVRRARGPAASCSPLLRATWILPSAIADVAMSRMIGRPPFIGAPAAIGLAERRRSLPPNGRDQNAEAGRVDEVNGSEPALGKHLRPGADPAEMAGIANRHRRHAVRRGARGGDLHRLPADDLAKAEIAVDDDERAAIGDDARVSVWPNLACAQPTRHISKRG